MEGKKGSQGFTFMEWMSRAHTSTGREMRGTGMDRGRKGEINRLQLNTTSKHGQPARLEDTTAYGSDPKRPSIHSLFPFAPFRAWFPLIHNASH